MFHNPKDLLIDLAEKDECEPMTIIQFGSITELENKTEDLFFCYIDCNNDSVFLGNYAYLHKT